MIFPALIVLHKLYTTSTVVNQSFFNHHGSEICIHELHTTSTAVKTAFWDFYGIDTGLYLLHSTYAERLTWRNMIFNGIHDLHMTSMEQESVCFKQPLQWWQPHSRHGNGPVRDPLNTHKCENSFICYSQHLNWHPRDSHGLHGGEKQVLWHSWDMSRCPQAPNHLYSGENCVSGPS